MARPRISGCDSQRHDLEQDERNRKRQRRRDTVFPSSGTCIESRIGILRSQLMQQIPRLRFAHLPTPIEELPRLSEKLDGPRLFVKRDDQTGLAFGGNKTRKLEFLIGEAQERGARTLITGGAIQSNHCRQTAAAAARYGFECT